MKNDFTRSAFGTRSIHVVLWQVLSIFLILSINDRFYDMAFRILVDLLVSFLCTATYFTDTFPQLFLLLWNFCRVA
jgi:hypothetical protein